MVVKSVRSVLSLSILLWALAAGAQTAEKAKATTPSELTVDESFKVTLDDNTILRKGDDGKPITTATVSCSGRRPT
jgi:hypothetical protein